MQKLDHNTTGDRETELSYLNAALKSCQLVVVGEDGGEEVMFGREGYVAVGRGS